MRDDFGALPGVTLFEVVQLFVFGNRSIELGVFRSRKGGLEPYPTHKWGVVPFTFFCTLSWARGISLVLGVGLVAGGYLVEGDKVRKCFFLATNFII